MQLIPVLDLKDGVVVHAKLGQRQHYLPLNTPLCPSPQLEDVMQAFLQLADFKTFYLADLNAIMGSGNNNLLLEKLLSIYPQIAFWIDSGYQQRPLLFAGHKNYQPVLGSESYCDETVADLAHFDGNFVLSLDIAAQQTLGAKRLFTELSLWPDKIIVMTLARVGSQLGVDWQTLQFYRQLAPHKTLIASGGIRDQADVMKLKQIGIDYALCATALHNQTITSADL